MCVWGNVVLKKFFFFFQVSHRDLARSLTRVLHGCSISHTSSYLFPRVTLLALEALRMWDWKKKKKDKIRPKFFELHTGSFFSLFICIWKNRQWWKYTKFFFWGLLKKCIEKFKQAPLLQFCRGLRASLHSPVLQFLSLLSLLQTSLPFYHLLFHGAVLPILWWSTSPAFSWLPFSSHHLRLQWMGDMLQNKFFILFYSYSILGTEEC